MVGEQAAVIKALNKRLTHCESDLQAHMEVSRLKNSLHQQIVESPVADCNSIKEL